MCCCCNRFAILTAKIVGDQFTKSLYEIHIELSGITLLETENLTEEYQLTPARGIMSKKVVCLREIESAATIEKVLTTTGHNGFPCVSDHSERFFVGMITRLQLEAALRNPTAVDLQPALALRKEGHQASQRRPAAQRQWLYATPFSEGRRPKAWMQLDLKQAAANAAEKTRKAARRLSTMAGFAAKAKRLSVAAADRVGSGRLSLSGGSPRDGGGTEWSWAAKAADGGGADGRGSSVPSANATVEDDEQF